MAKNGKLSKLKSIIKKWNSSSQINHTASCSSRESSEIHAGELSGGFHTVFVGKSRRRYLLSSDVVNHPIFQTLISRSGSGDGEIFVGCEVVLFEHLLWMLENADLQPEILEEIVDFYSCC